MNASFAKRCRLPARTPAPRRYFRREMNRRFTLLLLLAIALQSCYRQRCDYTVDDTVAEVPAFTRQWFPYKAGDAFPLVSGADTLRCRVERAGTVALRLGVDDHCPTQPVNGISGLLRLGEDTLSFQTGFYPSYLDVVFRGRGFTLSDNGLDSYSPDYHVSVADTVEIAGRLYAHTVRGVTADSSAAFFLTSGVGVSGVEIGGKVYGLVE